MRQHTAIHGAVVNDASKNAAWQVVSAAMSTCTATTGVKKMRILCGKSTTPPSREDVTELNDGGGRHRALPGGCAQLKNSPSTSMAADW